MQKEQDFLFGTQANASDIEEIKAEFHPLNTVNVNILFPVGGLLPMSGNLAPNGFLPCDGTVYNIADYPNLANYYENAQGSKNFYGGDGTTTFAVPDYRGEFLRGAGTNSHANQGNGANVGVHQDGTDFFNMLQWTESGSSATGSIVTYYTANDTGVINLGNKDATSTPATTNGKQVSFTGSKSDQNPAVKSFTGRPTNTSVLYCVKY